MAVKQKPEVQLNKVPGTELNTDPVLTPAAKATTVLYPGGADSGRKALATALAKAQAEIQNVAMNRVNPHFRSKYADLAAVREAVIPVFTKHGLAVIQAPTVHLDVGFALETTVIHESGESLTFYFPLPTDVNKMQAVGSAISYARRYTYSALAALASEDDDDGNAAQNPDGGRPAPGAGAKAAPGGIVL